MMEPGPFQQSFYPDGEHQYLLPDDDGALPAYATTRRTWIMFCVTFGVLHGCAVTSMVYASSLQGKDLSSASLGAFFAAYTTAALFVATDVVRRVQCGNQPVRQAGLEVLFTILAASTQRESAMRPRTRRRRLTHPNV